MMHRAGWARLLLSALTCLAMPLHAAYFDEFFIDPQDGMLDTSRYLSETPLGFLPVPIIVTEPAVGNGFGLVGVFFHESEEQKKARLLESQKRQKPVLPENVSVLAGLATENGTWAGGLAHLGFWFDDRLRYLGAGGYASVNMNFYSLGELPLFRPIELNLEGAALMQELKFRWPETNWFLGARQVYASIDTGFRVGGNLEAELPGTQDLVDNYADLYIGRKSITSGLGLLAEYDSVDSQFNPEEGLNWQAKLTLFDQAFGSDLDYLAWLVKGLNYWRLPDNFLLGVRLQYDGLDDRGTRRLPPYAYPYIDLRGVPANRYQGQDVAVLEAELGYRIDERWKVSLFSGTGRAANSISEISSAPAINTYGAGFRYLIARRYNFVVGLDYAKGPEDSTLYIRAGSSWR